MSESLKNETLENFRQFARKLGFSGNHIEIFAVHLHNIYLNYDVDEMVIRDKCRKIIQEEIGKNILSEEKQFRDLRNQTMINIAVTGIRRRLKYIVSNSQDEREYTYTSLQNEVYEHIDIRQSEDSDKHQNSNKSDFQRESSVGVYPEDVKEEVRNRLLNTETEDYSKALKNIKSRSEIKDEFKRRTSATEEQAMAMAEEEMDKMLNFSRDKQRAVNIIMEKFVEDRISNMNLNKEYDDAKEAADDVMDDISNKEIAKEATESVVDEFLKGKARSLGKLSAACSVVIGLALVGSILGLPLAKYGSKIVFSIMGSEWILSKLS